MRTNARAFSDRRSRQSSSAPAPRCEAAGVQRNGEWIAVLQQSVAEQGLCGPNITLPAWDIYRCGPQGFLRDLYHPIRQGFSSLIAVVPGQGL